MKYGFIGCGNMGGAILGGLAEVPGLELYGYNRPPQRLEPLCAKGVTAVPDIPGIAARCDVLVIGVKPYLVGGVLAEALPSLKPETVVISIAAGVTLHDLRDAVQGRCHVVRVMPNTPALVGAGVFGIQEDPALPKDVFTMILDLFGLLGSTIVLPEKKFNAFMALVGCGPAYVFHFMDALAEAGVTMKYHVGTMIEIPRAALTAGEIAKEADFFSFGTNDLTQMTFGFSRDDAAKFLGAYYENKIYESDPFQHLDQVGVGKLVKMAAHDGRETRPDLGLGICGEHGGDPSSVEFCHNVGLDYVSCSPFRVPIARLAAAQAAIKNPRK